MGRFEGKVVIVTGSSSGIGQDAARGFGREGACVVIHGQNLERIQKTEDELVKVGVPVERILKVSGSIEDEATAPKIIDTTIAKFGRLDVLVNNAGAVGKKGAEAESLDNLDFLFKLLLRGPIQLTKLALPHLEKTQGNVVNISSVGGSRAYPTLTYYGSLKAALDHITRNQAQLYGAKGVRVNSLCPGPIRTYIMERQGLSEETFEKSATTTTLLKRVGLCQEVTPALLLLASSEGSYITGVTLFVDGGCSVATIPLDLV